MVILALDIGQKKIGIAITSSGIIAQELTTIENNQKAIVFLADLVRQRKIGKIVVGLPVLKSGTISTQAKFVKGFMAELEDHIKLPVEYEDEYLTTKEAERILRETGLTQEQIKTRVDQMSAKIILEQYLNKI